jgi:hypothetical protein
VAPCLLACFESFPGDFKAQPSLGGSFSLEQGTILKGLGQPADPSITARFSAWLADWMKWKCRKTHLSPVNLIIITSNDSNSLHLKL